MSNNGEVRSAMEYLHGNITTGDVATLESSSMATHVGIQDTYMVSKETKEGCDIDNDSKKSEKSKSPLESSSAKHNLRSSSELNSTNSGSQDNCAREGKLETKKDLPDKKYERNEKPKYKHNKVEHRTKHNFEKQKFTSEKRDEFDPSRVLLSKEQLQEQIQCFVQSKDKELVFSNELTPQERFYVHSIAEEMILEHESRGEGENRHILVRKIMKKVEIGEFILFLFSLSYSFRSFGKFPCQ